MPYVRYSNIQEIVSYLPGDSAFFARTFSTVEAGIKLKSGDFILSGGYKNEYTYNNAPAGSDVNLTSGITDLGIEYRPDKKWVFAAGCKDIVFSGFEYPYTFMGSGWGYEPRQDFNNSVLSYGVSIDYQVTSFALTGISYTDTVIKDNTDEAFDYSAQEIDAKLTMKF